MVFGSVVEYVPEEDYELPLGKAEIIKEGQPFFLFFFLYFPSFFLFLHFLSTILWLLGKDVTVIGWGSQMYVLEQAVKMAEEKLGISCELIDLRTILPYDFETIEKVLLFFSFSFFLFLFFFLSFSSPPLQFQVC